MKFYPIPEAYEKKSTCFTVTCEGTALSVVDTPVSAIPFNQVWPGYQRPFDQTEPTSFVRLGSDGPFTLVITPDKPFGEVLVRPLSKNVKPAVRDGIITCTFPGVGQYSVELDGMHRVLTVFADPEKDFGIREGDANVLYFGAGVHKMEEVLWLEDGQTVYIDAGAVVYGAIGAKGKKNIAIRGYGILDNSTFERGKGGPVNISRCENVTVEGITVVDSSVWSMHFAGCRNVLVDNIKLIGMWRYNSDGCDFTNTTNAQLKNSYLRNYDDCVVIKGLMGNTELPLQNVDVENCVLWCDWGRALEIGAETMAPYIRSVHFHNIDIIHGDSVMLDLQHGDRAMISDIYFEDIRCEYMAKANAPVLQREPGEIYHNPDETYMPRLFVVSVQRTMYSHDPETGSIRNVHFRDIAVTTEDGRVPHYGGQMVTAGGTVVPVGSVIYSGTEGCTVKDVYFENITVNGVKYTDPDSLYLKIGKGAENVVFVK